jgi:DNA-binding beta-propeller fold protein YncE
MSKRIKQQHVSEFEHKFGPIGQALAFGLMRFSLDVVGIIGAYAVSAVPSLTSEIVRLFSFANKGDDSLEEGCDGLKCTPDGNVWISDKHRVQAFDLLGNFKFRAGHYPMDWPIGIAVNPKRKEVFVVDSMHDKVFVFSLKGEYLRNFKIVDEDDNKLDSWGIAVDGTGNVVLPPNARSEVRYVTPTGDFVHMFESNYLDKSTDRGIGVNSGNEVAIAHMNEVLLFNSQGELVLKLGGCPGRDVGSFRNPTDVTFDRHGNILVADRDNNRIQIFSRAGLYVNDFGDDFLHHPKTLSVALDGSVYVGDENGVHVYAFEHAE